MTEREKTAAGCLLLVGYVLLSIAIGISAGSSYGIPWGFAAFFAANGVFWVSVAVAETMRRTK